MKNFLITALFSTLFLTACNDPNSNDTANPLDTLVSQEISLTPVDVSNLKGVISFEKASTIFVQEQVCDRVQCGMELENVCHFVDVCTTVTPPPICKLVHGIRECVSGGPAQNVCNVEKQCHLQEMPKYCEVNCREVTVPRVKYTEVDSPLMVTLAGADATKDFKLTLGLHTTDTFIKAFTDPTLQPLSYLFENLQTTNKTLLLLESSQYKLSASPDFLKLASNFQRGDALQFTIAVQAQDENKSFSVLGSPEDFPSQNF